MGKKTFERSPLKMNEVIFGALVLIPNARNILKMLLIFKAKIKFIIREKYKNNKSLDNNQNHHNFKIKLNQFFNILNVIILYAFIILKRFYDRSVINKKRLDVNPVISLINKAVQLEHCQGLKKGYNDAYIQ